MCEQPTKNMKYMGPKSNVVVPIKRNKKTLIEHNLCYYDKLFGTTYNHIVVGFEAEKVIKSLPKNTNIGYGIILDYKNTNHGKIIKDILIKYNYEHSGVFITSDISGIITNNIDIDYNKSYVFSTKTRYNDNEITCNVVDGQVEHISYNTSDIYWTGACYLSNDAVKLLKYINKIKFTDPLFLLEIINYLKDHGIVFNNMQLDNKQYTYISNTVFKSSKVAT